MLKLQRTFSLALLSLMTAGVAMAQPSDTFEVRTAVVNSCIISANDLDFGTYDPNSLLPGVGTATIDSTCTLLTAYNIGLDAGVNGTGVADRKMVDDATGTEFLDYTLSCAGAGVPLCAVNWGNTSGVDTFTAIGTGLNIPVVIAGTIPSGQQVTPGVYRDTPVTATIFF